MIIVIFGLPGSGKTYFAKKLAERLEADYVGTDFLRKKLTPNPSYSEKEKLMVYKAMSDILYDHAKSKKHLVMDGTFYKKKIREEFVTMAQNLGLSIIWIEVYAAPEIVYQRLLRSRPDSDADINIHEKIKETYEKMNVGQLRLKSTDKNIEKMLKKALKYIHAKQYELNLF